MQEKRPAFSIENYLPKKFLHWHFGEEIKQVVTEKHELRSRDILKLGAVSGVFGPSAFCRKDFKNWFFKQKLFWKLEVFGWSFSERSQSSGHGKRSVWIAR